MKITVAKTAGFCFGVDRAVKIVESELLKGGTVATLGEIIHNPQIVKDFNEKGVRVLSSTKEIAPGERVVVRSHGVSNSVMNELYSRGASVVDATCPFVTKIHKIVKEQPNDTLILLAGDESHPEVEGIVGHAAGKVLVFKTENELSKVLCNLDNLDEIKVIMLAQTTYDELTWENCREILKKVCTDCTIFDTICSATTARQQEARDLAKKSDLMVVIGGRNSSNTTKLYEICKGITETVLIETAGELGEIHFPGKYSVGITAGASTPACIIKEVRKTMSDNTKNQEELSFEELLDQSFKSTYTGEKVTGVVTGIAPNEISIDIGTKHAGYLPIAEFTDDPSANIADLVKKGDELELMVVRVNDVEGTVMLSKKRLDAIAGFEKVMNAADTGEVFDGVVVDVVKGGVLALTSGVKVFIPASQTAVPRGQALDGLLKKKVSFKILEVNRQRKRAVGSIRAVVSEQRKELDEKFWSDVEVGKHYTGSVKSLTSYGAFVDLGGVDGMVHISELSWQRIKHPSQVVKEGDTVEVYVKDIDRDNKKISLGYKKTEDNPWEILKNTCNVGDVAKVRVVSMTTFGAFAQLIPGIDGLIHVSQISNERVAKPADVLSVGQEVDVKVTEIDYENKRVSLSMRALLEAAEGESDEPTAAEKADDMAKQVAQTASELAAKAADAAFDTKNAVLETVDDIKNKASDMYDEASPKIEVMMAKAGDAVEDMMDKAEPQIEAIKDKLADTLSDLAGALKGDDKDENKPDDKPEDKPE